MITRVGYIGGMGRSGSTLLERAIAEVPGFCALGEVRLLFHRGIVQNELCGCGQPFHSCPFWLQVGERAFGGWENVDTGRVRFLADRVDRMRRVPRYVAPGRSRSRDLAREYARYFQRIYQSAGEVSGARCVIDSSKNASTAYALRAAGDIDLSIVHIVRDSRGVAYSWTKSLPRPETTRDAAMPDMERNTPARTALRWLLHNGAFAVLRRTGIDVLPVTYEAFTADPGDVVSQVARFLGAGVSAGLDFVTGSTIILSANHQVAGNPMRFTTGAVQVRRDDEWRQMLPRRSRLAVAMITAPMLARYGYRLPAGRTKLRS